MSRDNLVSRQEEELKEFLLKHAGEPAGKVVKMKKKLEAKHEQGWN